MADQLIGGNGSGKGDYLGVRNNTYIIDLDTGERLGLMGLPKEILVDTKSSWATIRPFGKNTPNYHFTGAEDLLVLELTWWAEEDGKTDVLSKCKWLESMSKSDGNKGRPHVARLMWGTLWTKAVWIIQQAPYTIMDWDAERGLRPIHAKQSVTLARYNPENSTIQQIADWRY